MLPGELPRELSLPLGGRPWPVSTELFSGLLSVRHAELAAGVEVNLGLSLLTPNQLGFQGEARVLDPQATSGGSPSGHCPRKEAGLCRGLLDFPEPAPSGPQSKGAPGDQCHEFGRCSPAPSVSLLPILSCTCLHPWSPRCRRRDGVIHWRVCWGGGDTCERERDRDQRDFGESPAELQSSARGQTEEPERQGAENTCPGPGEPGPSRPREGASP